MVEESTNSLEYGKRLLSQRAYLDAEHVFETCCLRAPEDADAWFSLGVTRHRQQKHDAALLAFERALFFDHRNIAAHNARANMLAELGRETEALDALQQTLDLFPEDGKTLSNLGTLLYRMGELDEAITVFDQCLSMQPDQADALQYRANTYLKLDRPEEALKDADRLAKKKPSSTAYCLQATALLVLNRFEDALKSALKAQHTDPESLHVIVLCALAHAAQGEFDQAEALYSLAEIKDAEELGRLLVEQTQRLPRGIQSNPLALYLSLALRRLDECDWHNLAAFRRSLQSYLSHVEHIDGEDADRQLLEAACLSDTDPLLRLELSKFIALATRKQIKPFMHAPRLEPERLRIAYLAHSFDGEAMTRFTAGIFALHNRTRFEVIGYSLDPGDQSELNARIKQSCDQYVELFPLTPLAAAEKIRHDDVHILIDLTESGVNHPYEVFQYRPAPVQISFGDPYSSGCRAMHYRLTDIVASDQEENAHWVEKLVTLPDSHCVYDHSQSFLAEQPDRHDHGLPADQWVLCAFAPARCIEPEIFAAWMQIMRQIPDSVLWLVEWNPSVAQHLLKEAKDYGVNPKRLIFALPEHSADAHVTRLKLADLFLDTSIANSPLARDALWAGVPVLSLLGQTMAQRLSASQLHALDMPSLIADSFDQYVEKACRLLEQPSYFQILRRKLQRHVINRPLFHTQQTVLNLEAAYEQVWQQFQRGLPPAAMQITVDE